MFGNRIELEADCKYRDRERKHHFDIQGGYEIYSELIETFTRGRVSRFLNSVLDRVYDKAADYELSRRRYLRLIGPIRIPLIPVKQPA